MSFSENEAKIYIEKEAIEMEDQRISYQTLEKGKLVKTVLSNCFSSDEILIRICFMSKSALCSCTLQCATSFSVFSNSVSYLELEVYLLCHFGGLIGTSVNCMRCNIRIMAVILFWVIRLLDRWAL